VLHRWSLLLPSVIFFSMFLCIPNISGQERTKILNVTLIESHPEIDGKIEDICWKNVQPVSGFFQYDPFNGEIASEETLVWAAYD
jgi:hypothetical protein